MKNIHKIVMKTRKAYSGVVYQRGEIVDAEIGSDGRARVVRTPFVTLSPEQYDLYIPDQEYDRLLFMDDENGALA